MEGIRKKESHERRRKRDGGKVKIYRLELYQKAKREEIEAAIEGEWWRLCAAGMKKV